MTSLINRWKFFDCRISEKQNFWQLYTALDTQLLLEPSLWSTTSLAETISFLVLSRESLEKRWWHLFLLNVLCPSCLLAHLLFHTKLYSSTISGFLSFPNISVSKTKYSSFYYLSFPALVLWIHWWSCGQLPLSSETLRPGMEVKRHIWLEVEE